MLSTVALVQTDNGRIVYFRNSLSTEIRIFQEIEETNEVTQIEILLIWRP